MKKLSLAEKNNLIRAAVMGANDGILSVSGIVIGVAGATSSTFAIFIAGFAGALAGTVSMAMGEYVSVHSQNDAQVKAINEEGYALDHHYDEEFAFVKEKYTDQGISDELATQATIEMMNNNALATTVRERHGFSVDHEVSAIGAALTSMIAFPIGSLLPMLSITLFPNNIRVVATIIAVLVALSITGYTSAMLSQANRTTATVRNVVSGIFTMIVTYTIGTLMER